MAENQADFINLKIENEIIRFSKQLLIDSSNYFAAMFGGDFIERNQDLIELKAVKCSAMKIILQLLTTNNYEFINKDNVFSVLKTATMLQFLTIEKQCIELLKVIKVNLNNCDDFFVALNGTYKVHSLKDIYLDAKYKILLNFQEIGLTKERLAKFNLKDICDYLGNRKLLINHENDVFTSVLLWHDMYSDEISLGDTLKLLSCVDFSRITSLDIKNIKNNFDAFTAHKMLTKIIDCVIKIKNMESLEDFDEFIIKNSQLLLDTKRRLDPEVPCFIFFNQNSPNSVTIAYYDANDLKFNKVINFDLDDIQKLKGYRLMNYKKFLYLYGGEYARRTKETLKYHSELHVYNFLTEKVEQQTIQHGWFQSERRVDFDCVLTKNILYIIKGTDSSDSTYSVKQNCICWLNLDDPKHEVFQYGLPVYNLPLKSCNFQNQLLIICSFLKACFLFNQSSCIWNKVRINDPNKWIPEDVITIFSFNNKLFIKGQQLLELNFVKNQNCFEIVNKTDLANFKPFDQYKSVLCRNCLYTFYKTYNKETRQDEITFEIFNVDTLEMIYIFENEPVNKTFKFNNEELMLKDGFEMHPFRLYLYHCFIEPKIINTNFFQ